MQIVIDISAEDFEKVKYGRGAVSMMRKAIQRGIPLTKCHDRMIILSEDAVKREQTPLTLNFSCQKWISEVGLSNATVAIIEADAESEE